MIAKIPASLAGERVDRAVAALTGLARASVKTLMEDGSIMLDGVVIHAGSARVSEGQQLDVALHDEPANGPEPEPDVVFSVLYEDDDVIVVDKPAGLVVHPGAGHQSGTLVHGLLHRYADLASERPGDPLRPGIVHRLDAGTSGLLVIARNSVSYVRLVEMMKAREIERRYLALALGDLQPGHGVIDAPIGRSQRDRTRMAVSTVGRPARTKYEVLARHADPSLSLVLASLESGRTHQIRVHFAAIGHPIAGDRRYRGGRSGLDLDRPFLHARSLAFSHPISGERIELESPLPEDLQSVLDRLGLK